MYTINCFDEGSNRELSRLALRWQDGESVGIIGFPSFLSEAGMGIFVIGYTITAAYYLGTAGLAAFSVINYLHTFMFLAFIGIGSAIQSIASFYSRGSLD